MKNADLVPCRSASLSYALQVLRYFAEQGDEQERAVATQLANFVQRTERDQRRARIAGTRLLRAARRYKQAVKNMEVRNDHSLRNLQQLDG